MTHRRIDGDPSERRRHVLNGVIAARGSRAGVACAGVWSREQHTGCRTAFGAGRHARRLTACVASACGAKLRLHGELRGGVHAALPLRQAAAHAGARCAGRTRSCARRRVLRRSGGVRCRPRRRRQRTERRHGRRTLESPLPPLLDFRLDLRVEACNGSVGSRNPRGERCEGLETTVKRSAPVVRRRRVIVESDRLLAELLSVFQRASEVLGCGERGGRAELCDHEQVQRGHRSAVRGECRVQRRRRRTRDRAEELPHGRLVHLTHSLWLAHDDAVDRWNVFAAALVTDELTTASEGSRTAHFLGHAAGVRHRVEKRVAEMVEVGASG
mmetsp:Transcript_38557/g.119151  ORF Transcript_38557/g.119151 Transcript_38557/m.119151 type:complete len:328 (-) Transcript_38557:1467-2450(-)